MKKGLDKQVKDNKGAGRAVTSSSSIGTFSKGSNASNVVVPGKRAREETKSSNQPTKKARVESKEENTTSTKQNKANKDKKKKVEVDEEEDEMSDFGEYDEETLKALAMMGEEDEDMWGDEDEDGMMYAFGDEDEDGELDEGESEDDDLVLYAKDKPASDQSTTKASKANKNIESESKSKGDKAGKKEKATEKKDGSKDGDDDDEDDDSDVSELEANWDFSDPNPTTDYHAVKAFVRSLTGSDAFDAGGLADVIVSQVEVGTMVKNGDAGEEPLAFMTVVNLKNNASTPSLTQIKEYIVENAAGMKDQFEKVFTEGLSGKKNVGLLLHDRVVNTPLEVVGAMYGELLKDIDYARKEGGDDGKPDPSWQLEKIIVVGKCSDINSGKVGNDGQKKKNKNTNSNERWFLKFEEEYLTEIADVIRVFPTDKRVNWPGMGSTRVSTIAMVVDYSKFKRFVTDLQARIGGAQQE